MNRIKDRTGQRFGRLTVVGMVPREPNTGNAWWNCLCDCGNSLRVMSGSFTWNMSCGICVDNLSEAKRLHGGWRTPEHRAWLSMKERCRLDDAAYRGRGIKVCTRWRRSFSAFRDDMGPKPSPKHSIERKDNDGDYEPSNCVWATPAEQANNRRSNIKISHDGVTLTAQQWAVRTGVPSSTIYRRLKLNVPTERLFDPPARRWHSNVTIAERRCIGEAAEWGSPC